MQYLPPALEALTEQFAKLPGIGGKTAQRLAFYILSLPDGGRAGLRQRHPWTPKSTITYCPVCQNLTARGGAVPHLRQPPSGTTSVICVVADPKDVIAMERARRVPAVATMCSTGSSPP